jgi:hypothetical protein
MRPRLRPRSLALVVAAASSLALAACPASTMEGPLLAPTPHVAKTAADAEGSWRWFLDMSHDARRAEAGEPVGPGLRASVAPGGASAGRERTFVLVEGESTPIPVTRVRDPHAIGFPVPGGPPWDEGETSVEWWVCSRRRGTCNVEVDAVPHVVHACGTDLVLGQYAVRRTLAVGDAIVLAADPAGGSGTAGALVGEGAGRAGRLVLRVR